MNIDPDELAFLHRLANTAKGEDRHFIYLLANASAQFVSIYESYPRSFRRLTNKRGQLIAVEVSGD